MCAARRDWVAVALFLTLSSERRMAGLPRASESQHRLFRGADGVGAGRGSRRAARLACLLPCEMQT